VEGSYLYTWESLAGEIGKFRQFRGNHQIKHGHREEYQHNTHIKTDCLPINPTTDLQYPLSIAKFNSTFVWCQHDGRPDSVETLASRPPNPAFNLARLSHTELKELLQLAFEKHPDIGPSIKEVIARADARALAESLKPPPSFDYKSLRSSFHREAHSLDRLSSSQKFAQGYRLESTLKECIQTVEYSVNKNSPQQTVEEAFVCLQKFMGQPEHLDPYIAEQIVGEGGGLRRDIWLGMESMAKLLKSKGGATDPELKDKIMGYAKAYDDREIAFKEVFQILWGDAESHVDSGEVEGNEEDGSEEDISEDDGARSYKRRRYY
jgi:hypothetical protein